MKSDDIYESVAERIIKIAGGPDLTSTLGIPLSIAFESKTDMADIFKKAIFDYSIEKLEDKEENKIIVEDMGFIASRLNEQFVSAEEKEEFYKNYAQCLLGVHSQLIETKLVWDDVAESAKGEYPRIEGENFLTRPSTTNEEVTIWLFREFEKKLKEEKQKEQPKSTKTHTKKYSKRNPFKNWKI